MNRFINYAAIAAAVLCIAVFVASLFIGMPGYALLATVGVFLCVLPALAWLLHASCEKNPVAEESTQTVEEPPQKEHFEQQTELRSPDNEHAWRVGCERIHCRLYHKPFDENTYSKQVWQRMQEENPQEKQIIVDMEAKQQQKGKQ